MILTLASRAPAVSNGLILLDSGSHQPETGNRTLHQSNCGKVTKSHTFRSSFVHYRNKPRLSCIPLKANLADPYEKVDR